VDEMYRLAGTDIAQPPVINLDGLCYL
jgi:hypothetical protein